MHECRNVYCKDKYCDGLTNCENCGEDMHCGTSRCDACYNPHDDDSDDYHDDELDYE